MISWYGKLVSIVFCELTHDLCLLYLWWLGISLWACAKMMFPQSPQEDDIKCDGHQVCEEQVQDEHLEKITCLKLSVHW